VDTLTVSSKGQITVPKHLREQLKLHAGARVMVSVDAQRRLVLTPVLIEVDELIAARPPVERPLSLAQIDQAIALALAK
jgi:antitoxin PrlF